VTLRQAQGDCHGELVEPCLYNYAHIINNNIIIELVELIIKHPHPNPPPSRGRESKKYAPPSSGREYLYKSYPLAGRARGGGLKSLNFGINYYFI